MKYLYLLLAGIFLISCDPESEVAVSPYLTHVFEYQYGPGQHSDQALMSDTANLTGNPTQKSGFIFLGGWGGYVVAGFDHNVQNQEGNDLRIYSLKGASPEPAVVWVMADENTNGLPDDTWYELKGSQSQNSSRNYQVTYYKAADNSTNIHWKDNQDGSGELVPGYGAKYSQSWWWSENNTDSITLKGTRLPDAYENTGTAGSQLWTVDHLRYQWGYAENCYGTDYNLELGANDLDLDNAIDAEGNPVALTQIRFIKLQSAVFQIAGWTNEVSPEIKGAEDL